MKRILLRTALLCLIFFQVEFTSGQSLVDSTQLNSMAVDTFTAHAEEDSVQQPTTSIQPIPLRTTYYLTSPNALPNPNEDPQLHSFLMNLEFERPIRSHISIRAELRTYLTLSVSAWYKFRLGKQWHASVGAGHFRSFIFDFIRNFMFWVPTNEKKVNGFFMSSFFTFGDYYNNLSFGIRNYSNYQCSQNIVLLSLGGVLKLNNTFSLVTEANTNQKFNASFAALGIRLHDKNGHSLDLGVTQRLNYSIDENAENYILTHFPLNNLSFMKKPTMLFMAFHIRF